MPDQTRFELTDVHLKLLRRARVSWNEDQFPGAPTIDAKRPYGNGDVAKDVNDILGVEMLGEGFVPDRANLDPEGDEEWHGEMIGLHRQTETALQIVLATGSFEPGRYERVDWRTWRRVDG